MGPLPEMSHCLHANVPNSKRSELWSTSGPRHFQTRDSRPFRMCFSLLKGVRGKCGHLKNLTVIVAVFGICPSYLCRARSRPGRASRLSRPLRRRLREPLTELFHELPGSLVDPPHGLHQIFFPELDLHCSLWLQDAPPEKRRVRADRGAAPSR